MIDEFDLLYNDGGNVIAVSYAGRPLLRLDPGPPDCEATARALVDLLNTSTDSGAIQCLFMAATIDARESRLGMGGPKTRGT